MIVMPTKKRILLAIALVTIVCSQAVFAITYTVAKTGTADCKTINEALKRSQPGDVIKIMDASTYEEQVTIDSFMCPLTLTSKDPTSLNKPVIRYQDKTHVGPTTYKESLVDSFINFDQNAALRLIKVRNVIVDGIAVDGGGVYAFGYPNIWSNKNGLQHGNACITIWVSADVIVRNCDLSNAYFGINFKDRNLGGIFANPNPADNDSSNNVPLSGFALTGNHLIERNRIHDNSWGMFFESSWDLGSTIRYNLIYENHHPTTAIATKVHDLTSDEGANQPGGAFFFKDAELSPLAIYNNTLYHNFAIFCGHWQSGYIYLIFNNIFGPPYAYWNDAKPSFNTTSMELDPVMPYRIYNCVYSAQVTAPQPSYVRIMDQGFPQLQGTGGVAPDPGTEILGAGTSPCFPKASNVRWLEMDKSMFQSVDPTSASFLEPNWADESVKSFIVQQGWAESGVKNTDGTNADLGAIEQAKGTPSFIGTIKPTMPLIVNGTNVQVQFTLDERENTTMTNPVIKFFRLVRTRYKKDTFGSNAATGAGNLLVASADMTDIPVPATPPVKVGPNVYSITANITSDFAFIEMFIEATGADGKKFTTAAGFLPYRKLDYTFKVEVLDKPSGKVITEARVADTVTLRITPQKIGGTAFTNTVAPASVQLLSGFILLDASTGKELEYPSGITGATEKQVIFTKIPDGNMENISATGSYLNPSTKSKLPFIGGTTIKILSGPPEKIVFINPPSRDFKKIPPVLPAGYAYPCTLYVYDKYGNIVNSPAQVVVQSMTPTFANVVGGKPDTIITTNGDGVGTFRVKTENAAKQDKQVTFLGNVSGKTLVDTADMIVGPRAEHLFIFYSDTLKFDPTTELRGQIGDRLPITVIATKSDNPTIDSILVYPVTLTISGSNTKILFFESQSATTATNSFKLDKGRVTIWVSSTEELSNASVSTNSDDIIPSQPRDQIYFTKPIVSVDSAFYYANNGYGQVDSAVIYYKKPLVMMPDSITLYWPLKIDSLKRVISGKDPAMKLSADSMCVSISLKANPFPIEMTQAKTSERLGITYNRPNDNPGVQEGTLTFSIAERVGPLLMTPARVIERITEGPGIDTFTVTFSEVVNAASLTGEGLLLLQKGKPPSELTIQSHVSLGGNSFKLVVASKVLPQLGDSLKINPLPMGMIMDSLGNFAHPLNRPIPLIIKRVAPQIDVAYYLDNQDLMADGVVDSVVIKFNKKVETSDIDLSLEWTGTGGSNKADHIANNLLNYVGSDSTLIEVFVRGQFSGLLGTAIRTAGLMNATVKFTSLDETVTGNVADSAAPVCVDTAYYKPSPRPESGQDFADTLIVTLSEFHAAMAGWPKPFILSNAQSEEYWLTLTLPDTLVWKNGVDKFQYKFIVPPGGANFPKNGDLLWIDPSAQIKDGSGNIQTNRNNHKVPLHVFPVPYKFDVTIKESPFTPAPGKNLEIRIKPKTRMLEQINLSASGMIYDGLGNVLFTWQDKKFDQAIDDQRKNGIPVLWDCLNLNKRIVGTGVYVVSITVKQDGNTMGDPIIKKIGVKR
jgi:hypothetical protein